MNNRFFSIWNVDEAECSTGMKQNVAAVLACLVGIVFIFIETQNRFVRYCAVQSLFAGAFWMLGHIAFSVLTALPIVGVAFVLFRALFALGMMLIVGAMCHLAYHHKKLVLPFVSKHAEEWSNPDA